MLLEIVFYIFSAISFAVVAHRVLLLFLPLSESFKMRFKTSVIFVVSIFFLLKYAFKTKTLKFVA